MMKTILKSKRLVAIVAVALGIMVNAPVKAQDGMKVYLLPYKEKRALLKIDNYDGSKDLSVKVKDASGEVLYTEKLTGEGKIDKIFDFAFVKEGTYTLDVLNKGNLIRSVVTVTEANVLTKDFGSDLSKAYTFKQNIKEEDEKLMVKFQNKLEEPLTLKIFDNENGELIYKEANIDGENFAKLYDFSNLERGIYSMSISSETYSYHYDVDFRR